MSTSHCNVLRLGNDRVPAIDVTKDHRFQVQKSDDERMYHELFQVDSFDVLPDGQQQRVFLLLSTAQETVVRINNIEVYRVAGNFNNTQYSRLVGRLALRLELVRQTRRRQQRTSDHRIILQLLTANFW